VSKEDSTVALGIALVVGYHALKLAMRALSSALGPAGSAGGAP
jgi:hypothetical protein